jgi:replicative DNA helicase
VLRGRLAVLRRGQPAAEPSRLDPIRPTRLPAWDREVLEVLVGVPDSVGLIVREVRPADVETPACREVLETAQRLHEQGRGAGLADLLMELVDPALQSLLVAVDESETARATGDPHERVAHFAEALRRRAAERQAHAAARAIKTNRLDSRSESELLERLLAERRTAQGMPETVEPVSVPGMSAPKDG